MQNDWCAAPADLQHGESRVKSPSENHICPPAHQEGVTIPGGISPSTSWGLRKLSAMFWALQIDFSTKLVLAWDWLPPGTASGWWSHHELLQASTKMSPARLCMTVWREMQVYECIQTKMLHLYKKLLHIQTIQYLHIKSSYSRFPVWDMTQWAAWPTVSHYWAQWPRCMSLSVRRNR